MIVSIDTDDINLVDNTDVLESALDQLNSGWIVDVEFLSGDHIAFVKTYDDWFIPSNDKVCAEDMVDFIQTIQGNNPFAEKAVCVTFREPQFSDIAKQQNDMLKMVLNTCNGDMLLNSRFIKYDDFFLDTENELTPVSSFFVVNSMFLKDYQEAHDIMKFFEVRGGSEK